MAAGLQGLDPPLARVPELQRFAEHPVCGGRIARRALGQRDVRETGRHPRIARRQVLAGELEAAAPEVRGLRRVTVQRALRGGLLDLLPDDLRVRPARLFEKAWIVDRSRDGLRAVLRSGGHGCGACFRLTVEWGHRAARYGRPGAGRSGSGALRRLSPSARSTTPRCCGCGRTALEIRARPPGRTRDRPAPRTLSRSPPSRSRQAAAAPR